jgi:putative oxidoreductase
MIFYAPLIGRILMGVLFLIFGIVKFFNLGAIAQSIAGAGLPYSSVLAVLSACVEVVGGALLILGFKARYSAGVLILYTLVVTAVYHSDLFGTGQTMFLKNFAIIGGLLYAVAYGSGKYSFDKS